MATIDGQIQNLCNHTVTGERLFLNTDLVSLPLQFPLSAVTTITLFRFGVLVPTTKYTVLHTNSPLTSIDTLSPDDPTTVTGATSLYPTGYYSLVLNLPDLYYDPLYEVSYAVMPDVCPKCKGTQYTDDILFTPNNDFYTVTGASQLIQATEKFVVTYAGSNKYHQWVGSSLSDLLGTKISSFSDVSAQIQAKVKACLANLADIQVKSESINPSVSRDEVLANVEKIEVTQDSVEPSVVYVYIQYTSQSGNRYDFNQVLRLGQFRFQG